MRAFLLLGALTFSFYAQATETVNFTYFGNEGRNRIYLSCYYVENAVDSILAELGATNVDTRCTGGIDYGFYTPVRVTTKFDLPVNANTVKIKSDFNSNCYFDVKFINNLVRNVEGLEKLSGSSHCFNSDSSYNFTLQLK